MTTEIKNETTDPFLSPADLTDQRREIAYQQVGREQLMALLDHGLSPDSYVLDIGCGKLRCGRWVIPVLDPGHYCGIEPVPRRVEIGLRTNVPQEIVDLKKPRFDHNSDFDFSVFNTKFTHFVARSIWSHASKGQIEKMLDGVAEWGAPGAVCLASFRATAPGRKNDYMGEEWKGRSHDSDEPGIVAHSVRWIDEAATARGLVFEVSERAPVKKNGQVWAVIHKPAPGSEHEELLRNRVARATRQIRHNIRTLKLAIGELKDALDRDGSDDVNVKPRPVKKALKALQASTDNLTDALAIDEKQVLGT